MKGLPHLLSLLGIAAASAYGLAGCGGDEITCGAGTVLEGDMCVPENTTTCGEGTTLQNGECVPDGSVICEQGTRYDMATGTCVVDPSACAEGTVLVGGECVPEDDTLTADMDEATEPNDMAGAGMFNVPALNEDVTIHGCITPRDGEADSDPWIMTATGPTLLEITADGVGGLAAGFIVQDLAIPQLPNYSRFGVNLVGDTSKRQVYLPTAGSYVLVMDDSRALLLGEAAGNADTCYYGTIKTVAMPAATAATLPMTTGEDSGNVRVLSYQADQIGDIFDITQTTTSTSMVPAFIVRKNGQLYASAAFDQTNDVPPFYTVGGLETTDTIEIVVDEIYNFGIEPQPYTFEFFDIAAQALPTNGAPLTVTKKNGTIAAAPWWENNYLYFDVATAGQVVHFDLTASESVRMRIVRRDVFTPTGAFANMAAIATSGAGTDTFEDEYVRFLQPGRYYFVTFDSDGTAAQTYTVTSTLVANTPSAVTYGTVLANQPLPAQGSGFHTLDLSGTSWIQTGVSAATDWGTAARVSLYNLAGEGWLDNNYVSLQADIVPTNGSTFGQRVTHNDSRDYLVRVESTTTPGAAPIYSLDIKERPHAVLGMLTSASPINRTGMDDVAAGASKGFIVSGVGTEAMLAQITPTVGTVDISAERRNTNGSVAGTTSNTGGAGATEVVQGTFAASPANFLAFTVNNTGAASTNLTLGIAVQTPRMYTVATGALAYSDACVGGTTIMTAEDDLLSATESLPSSFAAFPLLGVYAGPQVKVSSNGFITFDTASIGSGASNAAIPTASSPGAMVAGFWNDLTNITVCRKDDGTNNTVTFQWVGQLYNQAAETAQFQIVLHSNGVIDLIYGAAHLLDGSEVDTGGSNGATVGVENLGGTFGQQLVFNTAGIAPSTSRTLTPM